MADARSKKVLSYLAPLYEEANFAIDLAATQMREPLGMSDIIDIPDIDALTVTASGATTTSPQAVTTNALSLNANLQPWINAKLPLLTSAQAIDGRWAEQTSTQAVQMLKNSMDSDFCEYLIERNFSTASTPANHVNTAASTPTTADVLNAVATLTNHKGVDESNLAFLVSSWGRASLSNISGFVPNATSAGGSVNGLPPIGTVFNIPVYQTSAVPNGRTVVSTAFSDDGSDMTITVPSGHGIVKGMSCDFSSATSSNDFTGLVVQSATATTIVFGSVHSGGSATENGSVTVNASENLLVDKSSTYVAQQMYPTTRIVPLSDSTGSALQISAIWGRVARANRAVIMCTPKSSI